MALLGRFVAALGTVLILTMACAPATSSPTAETSTALAGSSPSATATAPASATSTPLATATGTARRTPIPVAAARPSDLVVRVERSGELCCPSAAVVVMADGRFVTRTDDGKLVERKLTAAGTQRVRDEVLGTGLFQKDQYVAMEPAPGATPPAHGISGITIRVWNGTKTVSVSTAIVPKSEESFYKPSPARDRLLQLSTQLLAPEQWLSAAAWATSTPFTHVITAYRLFLSKESVGGSPPDVEDIDWPFTTPLMDFGDPALTSQIAVPIGPGEIRCATLVAADMGAVRNALEHAGGSVVDFPEFFTTVVVSRATGRGVALLGQPLLPDQSSCADAY